MGRTIHFVGALLCLCALPLPSVALPSVKGLGARIVGGTASPPRHARHMALLRITFQNLREGLCSGTVVGNRWIMGSAHCFRRSKRGLYVVHPQASYAYIGETRAQLNAVDNPNVPAYYFRAVYVHRDFRPGTSDFRHDIALVELVTNITPNRYFPISLGSAPRTGSIVVASGYGLQGENGPYATELKSVKLVTKSTRSCKALESRDVIQYIRTKRHVCAVAPGYPTQSGKDSCYGDSGGPLMYKQSSRLVQFAITSFATGQCGEAGSHAYYTRVSAYRRMISDRINSAANNKWTTLS